MKFKPLRAAALCLLVASFLFPADKVKEKDLPSKYRRFLDLTSYIMLEEEREVFLQLTNERERDAFIEMFWKQRDPTPGTEKNEYKEEHIKRFKYANEYLGRSSPREGWKTDQGRIHIILGRPVSIEHFEVQKGLYPAQAWYYYGDKSKGLPGHFAILFFKRKGFGEWKLYDYTSDGPAALLIDQNVSSTDFAALYDRIKELSPTLALVSHSMIPGQIPFNFAPSPENNIIMANIFESPKKDVNPVYATSFLDYKGIVSTEYMTNYKESVTDVSLIRDPQMGLNFVHFSIAPQDLSVDYYEPNDQYFCNFELNVSLRQGEEIIYQYTKNYPFYFAPEDLERVRANGVAIEDSFPVTEGKYELTALLKNSVAKEFTILEEQIEVQEDSGSTSIIGPFIGYRFREYQGNLHIPYKVLDKKLVLEPSKNFSSSDNISFLFMVNNIERSLWENGKIELLVQGLKENNPVKKSYSILLKSYPFRKSMSITHSISSEELTPDYYQTELRLMDKQGTIIDNKTEKFVISPFQSMGHPISHSKGFPLSNSFVYYYILATQNRNLGHYDKAGLYYQKAYEMNPEFKNGVLDYTGFLIETGKYNKALEMVKQIQDDEQLRFRYHLLKGKALMGLERYQEAIESLLEGNKIYNSDTALLNSLGFCYHKLKKNNKALDALRASLKLNPKQENVKNLIEEIEKKN